jgi:hypothetical protein
MRDPEGGILIFWKIFLEKDQNIAKNIFLLLIEVAFLSLKNNRTFGNFGEQIKSPTEYYKQNLQIHLISP